MCGIAGFFDRDGIAVPEADAVARRMARAIATRGPDDEDAWADGAGIALGFRRLAILDLSPLGRQPMASAFGRYTIVFNGEIYNYLELREELRAKLLEITHKLEEAQQTASTLKKENHTRREQIEAAEALGREMRQGLGRADDDALGFADP